MKYVISFSGGIGSAISAMIAHDNNLDFELVFADTLIEDGDLYRFIVDVAESVGKKIHWLKDGRTPWEVFVDKKYIGNTRTAHCSSVLKTDQVRKWLSHLDEDFTLILGMDHSEIDRLERAQKQWSDVCNVRSLINDYKVWRPQWSDMLATRKIIPPRLYDMGFPHNNCGGMCVRAGLKQFATLYDLMPDRFEHHAREQQKTSEAIGPTARPFLRYSYKGTLYYITLDQFKQGYTSGELKVSPYDYGGCGCFTDEVTT